MIPNKLPPPSRADAGPSSDALRARGLRLTRPRRVILEVVRATDAHPSASLVYEAVRRRLPRVSLGTVYRNLRRLAAEGLVQERAEPTGLRFDGNLAPHDHFTCVACGRVLDVPRRRPTADAGGSRSRAGDPEPSRRVLRPLRGLSPPQPLTEGIVMAGKSLKNTKSLDNLKEAFDTELVGKLGSLTAPLSNWMNEVSVHRVFVQAVLGIHKDGNLPRLQRPTFSTWFRRRPRTPRRRERWPSSPPVRSNITSPLWAAPPSTCSRGTEWR